jgi:hypothetical protein
LPQEKKKKNFLDNSTSRTEHAAGPADEILESTKRSNPKHAFDFFR